MLTWIWLHIKEKVEKVSWACMTTQPKLDTRKMPWGSEGGWHEIDYITHQVPITLNNRRASTTYPIWLKAWKGFLPSFFPFFHLLFQFCRHIGFIVPAPYLADVTTNMLLVFTFLFITSCVSYSILPWSKMKPTMTGPKGSVLTIQQWHFRNIN